MLNCTTHQCIQDQEVSRSSRLVICTRGTYACIYRKCISTAGAKLRNSCAQTTRSPIVKSAKEKIEEFDEAKKKVAYSVIGGDMMQYYKTFKATLEVIPEGEGSVVKWICEFEKASEEVPDPNMIRDFAANNFQKIDAYLLQA